MNLTKDEKRKFYKALITLAIPMILQNAIGTALNFIDTFMISSLSTDVIAGVTAANRIFFLVAVICFGASSGSSVLIAQYHGVRDEKNIKRTLGGSILLVFTISAIISLIAFISPEFVLSIVSNDENVVRAGAGYLRFAALTYVPMAISSSYSSALKSTEKVNASVIISSISVLINTFLNYALIFGNFGFEKMGAPGAGLATLIARLFEFVAFLVIIYGFDKELGGSVRELFAFDKVFVNKFSKTVIPVLANETVWVLGMTVYSVIFGHMEGDALAAVGIIDPVVSVIMFAIWGLVGATAVLIGNKIGAGEGEKIFDYARSLIRLMFVVSLVIAALLYFLDDSILLLFPIEESLRATILQLLIVVIAAMPLRNNNFLLIVGLMRSGGDTKYCFYIEMLSLWLIGIPVTVFAGLFLKLDLFYVFALMIFSDELVKFFFGMTRIYSKKWVNNLTI